MRIFLSTASCQTSEKDPMGWARKPKWNGIEIAFFNYFSLTWLANLTASLMAPPSRPYRMKILSWHLLSCHQGQYLLESSWVLKFWSKEMREENNFYPLSKTVLETTNSSLMSLIMSDTQMFVELLLFFRMSVTQMFVELLLFFRMSVTQMFVELLLFFRSF